LPVSTRVQLRVVIMAALRSRCGRYVFALWFLSSSFFLSFFMVALWNRADHYIFILNFFPLLTSPAAGRRLDVYHTSTHDVALVRI